MNRLYQAKEVTVTPSGSTVIILQDSPISFHVSVNNGDNVIYDNIIQPQSMEELRNNIHLLEKQLLTP